MGMHALEDNTFPINILYLSIICKTINEMDK